MLLRIKVSFSESLTVRLLQKSSDLPLAVHESPTDLANEFATFFTNKVAKVQASKSTPPCSTIPDPFHEPPCSARLPSFSPLSTDEVAKLIANSPTKSCSLDPIPGDLFTSCLPTTLPIITKIINLSLKSGSVPSHLKDTQLTPILKKHNLDLNILNNYRPISNLAYLYKLFERAIAQQLTDYMSKHELHESLQFAYCKARSTETAIIFV